MCNLTRKIERIYNASLGGIPVPRWERAAHEVGWEIVKRAETKGLVGLVVVRENRRWTTDPGVTVSVAKLSNRRAMLRAFQTRLRLEGA